MDPQEAKSIFLHAVEHIAPDEWPNYLSVACGENPSLRHEVEVLLAAHQDEDLADQARQACADVLPTIDPPITEQPGTQVGPYKLLQQIGEGGMGVVYMADQMEPVKRRVALKIIKPGMDTRQVIARFEAERQALAMMDHPNIAKILDGGTTDSGRPYFVMELVKGIPITKYSDAQHLTPKQRLDLFIPVCQAVQHAHQKGIIHRDLKPSNVLIALYDNQPVPKVIDFGVAKATSQKLTDKTMFTDFGQIVGTLEYMSPEQANLNQLDVDTRSDIYSLGVLLYELLTGATPFDRERLRSAAFEEMMRIIREEEPPKPSTRLSTIDTLPSVAANRHIEPKKLRALVRGELDWIVMKALEKDRARRYETANGFANDIQRYLNDEAVVACPPSRAYRFRKFVRRNRQALAAASLLGLALLVAVGAVAGSFGWMARDHAARQARVSQQVELILADVERLEEQQNWPEALATAHRAETLVAGGEVNAASTDQVRKVLADLELVRQLEETRLLQSQVQDGGIWNDLAANARAYARVFNEAGFMIEELPIETAAAQLRSHPRISIELATALMDWASLLRKLKDRTDDTSWQRLLTMADIVDPDPWRSRLRSIWRQEGQEKAALRELAASAPVEKLPPSNLVLLGSILHVRVAPEEGSELLRRAQHHFPGEFWINYRLGYCLLLLKQPEEAVAYCRAALAIRPQNVPVLNNLGVALRNQGKLQEAIACYRKAIELDPKHAKAHGNMGVALGDQGELEKAIACFRTAVELDPKDAKAHGNLGAALEKQGELDEAIACSRKAIELDAKNAGSHHNLGLALSKEGERDEAIACYRKAIELDPKFALAHAALGLALKNQGEVEKAIAYYRKAIELDPNFAAAHNNLGIVLWGKGAKEEAIACFRKAVELDPKNANAHANLGLAQEDQGELEKAIAYYRKAIELDPIFGLARDNLASLYTHWSWRLATAADVSERDPAEAVELAKLAIELLPDVANHWNNLGVAQYRAGNWQAAVVALEKADAMLEDGDRAHRMFLAMAHWQLGDKEQARELYAQGAAWIAEHQEDNEEQNRFRAEAERLMGITEEERRRLIEEYLARPTDETAEALNEKPDDKEPETGDQGPEKVEAEEPATDP